MPRKQLGRASHPVQPLVMERDGIVRFKQNKMVRYLLDAGPFDLNQLAIMPFSNEDREQFSMLTGYSLSGFSTLSYVTDKTYDAAAAQKVHKRGEE